MKNSSIAIAALLFSLSCQRQAAPPAPVASAASTPPAAAVAAPEAAEPAPAPGTEKLVQSWNGDLDGMVQRRVIRVLVVPSKTYYFVENGQPRGTAFEAFTAFEDELNKKLGKTRTKVHVAFLPTSRADLIPALLAGHGDVVAAGLAITSERRQKVDFTRPVWDGVSEIAVTGPSSPVLAKLDDLCGQEVFVRRASSYWEHLEELNRRLCNGGKSPVKLREAPGDLEDEDLLEMLNAGLFKIAVVNDLVATLWAKIYPEIHPHPEVAVATGGELAWMIRQGSPKLKAELDAFIATHGKGTTFGNTVASRYLGSTKFILRSTSPQEIKKFQDLVAMFRRYSGQYDVDYLMVMAQGYQESRLDQSVKSPVGAIGVMQLMPTTAAELQTGDPQQVEANIHGGVKYLRFMMDRYYKDEPMTKLNKALFTFASYNAGPARVQKLRTEAAARGLDPNVWFNNVELVAADRIGSETVTYVSSIYKYYVAYTLVAEQDKARQAAKAGVKAQ